MPTPALRSMLVTSLALAVVAPQAAAQSFTSWNSSGYSALGARRSHNAYVFINGRYVIHTPLPALGIHFNTNRSRAAYPFASFGVDFNGLSPYALGYPPYYGPNHYARWSQWNYTFHQYEYNARPWYWSRAYNGPPLLEIARRIDPALVDMPAPSTGASAFYPPPPPSPPMPPVDAALEALSNRNYEIAAKLFMNRADERRDIESDSQLPMPPDRTALRLRALALAGYGRYEAAAQAIEQAYNEDPSLSDSALLGARLIDDRTELRRIVNGAVAFAHGADSPGAWRLVATLMQAEGREQLAQQMLNRAGVLATPAPTKPVEPTVPGGEIPPDIEPPDAPAPN